MSPSAPAERPSGAERGTLIVIPTYNELENLPIAVTAVLEALPDSRVLVVDDSSPDGTGALADVIAAREARVHVLHRRRAGNACARVALALPVHDVTAGFRLHRAHALRVMDLGSVRSKGYCFQIDRTVRLLAVGGRIAEVPIEFREREFGTSKMSRAVVIEAMALVTIWGVARVLGRPGRRIAERLGSPVVRPRPSSRLAGPDEAVAGRHGRA